MVEQILERLSQSKQESCYRSRIQYLRREGLDTTMIENAIFDTSEVLDRGGRSFVVYGEPQSGKTEFMIALACKLVDDGYETIFVVMNDNTELETQNFDRFHMAKELNPTPLRDWQVTDMDASQLRAGKKRIIFCRKNSHNLDKLIEATRFMEKRILIDDEADYASPNTNINKRREATAINRKVGELAQVESDGVYIGVTATPGRLDLNNTFMTKSSDWVFMEPHSAYKGRSFFFPVTAEDRERSDYILTKLSDEGDDSKHLRSAIYRFLLRASLLNHPEGRGDLTPYSMLIHTAGKTSDHVEDKRIVDKVIGDLSDPYTERGKRAIKQLHEEAIKMCTEPCHPDPEGLVVYVLNNIGKHEVLIINHTQDSGNVLRATKPKSLFTFAIGGNIVSRGLTFENLLTFFFSRNVKGKMQQNTYIQRARMFGNRPYSKYFELCVPESLFENWAETFQNHELSLRLAKSGGYKHIETASNAAADSASIDKEHVDTMSKGERTIGAKQALTPKLEKALLTRSKDPVRLIRDLIEAGDLDSDTFPEDVLTYIEETSISTKDQAVMVLRSPRDGEDEIQEISSYRDGDEDTITRARSGIIDAIIHKRDIYAGKVHYILPIKNAKGDFRFIYKNALGHRILLNKRNTKKRGE